MKKKYLITSAWPYVNGEAHIGHIVSSILPSDIYKRFCNLCGRDSIYVSGADMHGTPTQIIAQAQNKNPLEIAYFYKDKWEEVLNLLNIKFDLFTDTETNIHKNTVQTIFLDLYKKGYIFKDKETQPYCENDKRFIPDRFVEGICPNCGNTGVKVSESCEKCNIFITFENIKDPKCKICNHTPIIKDTENFFLDLPKFQDKLTKYIESKKNIWRKNAIDFTLSYLKEGLKPRSITRDLDYGISVPLKEYENKVIYVWFEALIGYYSASVELKGKNAKEYWSSNSISSYFLGKDNIMFHTIILPAILMGLGDFQMPTNIISTENIIKDGEKLSKSKHKDILINDLVKEYGTDYIRFYLAGIMPENKDCNFTKIGLEQFINAHLCSNIGNYIHRTLTFLYNNFEGAIPNIKIKEEQKYLEDTILNIKDLIDKFKFQEAIYQILRFSDTANKKFNDSKIWENKDEKAMFILMQYVYTLCVMLKPFIPESIEKIEKILNTKITKFEYNTLNTKITKPYVIFEKIEKR